MDKRLTEFVRTHDDIENHVGIDTYNMAFFDDISVTITTRVSASNCIYMRKM